MKITLFMHVIFALIFMIYNVEAQITPIELKEKVNKDLDAAKQRYNKHLPNQFKDEFMLTMSDQLKYLLKSQIKPLLTNENLKKTNKKEKELKKSIQKRFIERFFFENEAWVNSMLQRFKKDFKKHNKQQYETSLTKVYVKINEMPLDEETGNLQIQNETEFIDQSREAYQEQAFWRYNDQCDVYINKASKYIKKWFESLQELEVKSELNKIVEDILQNKTIFDNSTEFINFTVDDNYKNKIQHPMHNLSDQVYESWIEEAFEASSDEKEFQERTQNDTIHTYYAHKYGEELDEEIINEISHPKYNHLDKFINQHLDGQNLTNEEFLDIKMTLVDLQLDQDDLDAFFEFDSMDFENEHPAQDEKLFLI